MKKLWKTAFAVAGVAVVMCSVGLFAACGGESDDEDTDNTIGAGTYTYNWTSLSSNTAETTPYTFNIESIDMSRALDVTLTLSSDGTYELDINCYMIEDTEGGTVDVGEKFEYGDSMYYEWVGKSTGTYTSTETTVSITSTYEYYYLPNLGSSYLAQLFATGSVYSILDDQDDYYGKWDSNSSNSAVCEKLKEQYRDTTFTISGSTITNWVESGYTQCLTSGSASLYLYASSSTYACYLDSAWYTGSYTVSDGTLTLTYSYYDSSYTVYTETWTGSASEALTVVFGDSSASFTLTDDILASL